MGKRRFREQIQGYALACMERKRPISSKWNVTSWLLWGQGSVIVTGNTEKICKNAKIIQLDVSIRLKLIKRFDYGRNHRRSKDVLKTLTAA